MNRLFLLLLLLWPVATRAQTLAPSLLADMQDEVDRHHLKRLKTYHVSLPAPADTAGLLTFTTPDLTIRIRKRVLLAARAAAPAAQKKYTAAAKYLTERTAAGQTRFDLSERTNRNLEHLLATWALPLGKAATLSWRGQPLPAYEAVCFGPAGAAAPAGAQVVYCHAVGDRKAGFYSFVSIPRPKGK